MVADPPLAPEVLGDEPAAGEADESGGRAASRPLPSGGAFPEFTAYPPCRTNHCRYHPSPFGLVTTLRHSKGRQLNHLADPSSNPKRNPTTEPVHINGEYGQR